MANEDLKIVSKKISRAASEASFSVTAMLPPINSHSSYLFSLSPFSQS
jgi:hypothetical protein